MLMLEETAFGNGWQIISKFLIKTILLIPVEVCVSMCLAAIDM